MIREIVQRKYVTILLYHDIQFEKALSHFSYLKKKYNIISLQEFIYAYKNNSVSDLPKKSLIITLDDGNIGNYKLLPLIKELKIPITIFLCSHIIGTNRHYWFDQKTIGVSVEQLKKMENQEKLNILKKNGFELEREYPDRKALSCSEIIEMSAYIDFQSHSRFHPCLPYCSNQESEREIINSKNRLEELFKFKINAFSYPNGDYSDREIDSLKKSGYEAGLTCDLWFNNQKTDLYRLKRLACGDEGSIVELETKVTGIYIFLKKLFLGKECGFLKTK